MFKTFAADLKFGQGYEMNLLKFVDHDGYAQAEGVFKKWDMKLFKGDACTTYEVKADRMAVRTGNIALEYESSGKPSGIRATTADYWAIFTIRSVGDYDCYIIPTSVLKAKADSRNYRFVGGCENKKNKMYLIPLVEFEEYLILPEYSYEYDDA
jgi:hypothetical protein